MDPSPDAYFLFAARTHIGSGISINFVGLRIKRVSIECRRL
jgi:hypothetical protein